MRAEFDAVAIEGVLGVVPTTVSRFDDEVANYAHDAANTVRLKEMMGYDEHRIAPPGVTAADLALAGISRLVEEGKVDPSAVGALIFISQTPDYRIPPTSMVLHGKLKLAKECYCVDINDGCAGYIKGLFEAAAFLRSSDQEIALLVTADVLSPYVSVRDRNSYPLVGDAATITLLRKKSGADRMRIRIENDGTGAEALMIPAGGSRLPSSPETAELHRDADGNWRALDHLSMRGGDVFAFTQSVVPAFISSFLVEEGRTAEDFDYLFLHQASAFILERLRRKLKVDAVRLPDQVARRYGNSSASTIPMGIALHVSRDRPVDAMLCGFGVGLSWGAATVRLRDLQFCQVIEVEGT